MKHVFSCLLKVGFRCESGEGYLLREEIDFENVTFFHGVREVTLIAAVVFWGGSNVPADFAMLAKGGTRFRSNVGDDFGAKRGEGCPIEVIVSQK